MIGPRKSSSTLTPDISDGDAFMEECADVAEHGLTDTDYEDMNRIFGKYNTDGRISFFCNNTVSGCND